MKVSILIGFILSAYLYFCLHPDVTYAGECLTTNDELYSDIVNHYRSAKKGRTEKTRSGWGLGCWQHNKRSDAKLKKLLKEIIFDSRIHPADVAKAIEDYEIVFGKSASFKMEMISHQGESRYDLINKVLTQRNQEGIAAISSKTSFTFSPAVDFIRGPANVSRKPNGKIFAKLPDYSKIRIVRQLGEWAEIERPKLKGWIHRKNLMGATINSVDDDGFTDLSRAAYLGYEEAVNFLLGKGTQANLVDSYGRNALHWAVAGGSIPLDGRELEILKTISMLPGIQVNKVDKAGDTPLLLAVKNGRLEVVKILLQNKEIDVNAADRDGMTPLSLAVRHRHQGIVNILLGASHISLDRADSEGRTPLFYAVAAGELPVVQLLLKRKAKTDTITTDGKTLYHAAFWSLPFILVNIDIIKLLLECKNIDINASDKNGNTALSLAIDNRLVSVVELLLTAQDLDVNKKTRGGNTYLSSVLYSSNPECNEIALLLLDRKEIDVNVTDNSGYTPVYMNWIYYCPDTSSMDISKKILDRNPNLEVVTGYGETPLIYNINQKREEMVKLLASAKNIDLNHPDSNGKTPLHIASAGGLTAIVDKLVKAGASERVKLGDEKTSPEGIPQVLLNNDSSDEAISFYRKYLIALTEKTLEFIRERKPDEAIKSLEFILDEITAEVGSSMPKLSVEQRRLIHDTFMAINGYYQSYPRKANKWYQSLGNDNKEAYSRVDALLAEILSGKFASMPDGELKKHLPMVPILIFRGYMARNSITALTMIREGKTSTAEQFMRDVMNRSKSKYFSEKDKLQFDE